MTQSLESLTAQVLDIAASAGATSAEALAIDGTSLSITVRDGDLEKADRSEGVDLGLRVFVGQKQACVSTSDTSPESLRAVAERAVAMAKVALDDPYIRQAEPGEFTTDTDVSVLDLYDPADEPEAAALKETAQAIESAALTQEGITQSGGATAAYGSRRIHLMTSAGFSGGYARSDNALSCTAIAGSGAQMERDTDGDYRVYRSDLRSPEDIGTTAATRALEAMGARKPPTGTYPVLYDERISSGLIGHILAAINGQSIARGSSWLRDKLGEQILPESLSIIEDPHRPRVQSSKLFDGEGLATSKRAIVENGVLQSWTMDLSTAAKLGLQSTASAARGTGAPPSPSVGNAALTQGDKTQAELLRNMGTGLLVTEMIGNSINPTTGDYSRGAAGFWVENGEIAYPVNECTLAGNLLDISRTMIAANDARTHLSRVVPSLLVEGLTIAGA
ncbi:MAG: TldD/PmbA family protein [Planktomarina sp.]